MSPLHIARSIAPLHNQFPGPVSWRSPQIYANTSFRFVPSLFVRSSLIKIRNDPLRGMPAQRPDILILDFENLLHVIDAVEDAADQWDDQYQANPGAKEDRKAQAIQNKINHRWMTNPFEWTFEE